MLKNIKSKRIFAPIARWVEPPDGIMETADLVIGHKTMTTEEWLEMYLFAWLIASCHHMGYIEKVVRFVREHYKISYEEFYKKFFDYIGTHPNTILGEEYLSIKNHILQIITEDEPKTFWGRQSEEFPEFQGEKEELSCLMYIKYKDRFYKELSLFIKGSFKVDSYIIDAIIKFQKDNVIDPTVRYPIKTDVEYNFMDVILEKKKLKKQFKEYEILANNFNGDYLEYGTSLYYKRKTGAGRVKIIDYEK